MELSKQEMELFLLFPDLWSKNFFYEIFLTFTNKEMEIIFPTGCPRLSVTWNQSRDKQGSVF